MPTFDLAAFRVAHPDSTPADAEAAHRQAIEDALHDQFLALLTALGPRLQLAVLQGQELRVSILADEAEPAPTYTGPQLVGPSGKSGH